MIFRILNQEVELDKDFLVFNSRFCLQFPFIIPEPIRRFLKEKEYGRCRVILFEEKNQLNRVLEEAQKDVPSPEATLPILKSYINKIKTDPNFWKVPVVKLFSLNWIEESEDEKTTVRNVPNLLIGFLNDVSLKRLNFLYRRNKQEFTNKFGRFIFPNAISEMFRKIYSIDIAIFTEKSYIEACEYITGKTLSNHSIN